MSRNEEYGLVTGRYYAQARERGFAVWNPSEQSRSLVDAINGVLAADRQYWPMTARQIFYRLVAHGYQKTEKSYKRLLDVLNRGRRAELIPWAAIRDDGSAASLEHFGTDEGDVDWLSTADAVRWFIEQGPTSLAAQFDRNRAADQEKRVELWVEAGGMVPQMRNAVDGLPVIVRASGGFESLTVKHSAAMSMAAEGRTVVMLFVGDYDESGLARMDSAAADVVGFLEGRVDFEVEHVAVTERQIEDMDLEEAPPKRRSDGVANPGGYLQGTVQAEAIPPGDLARIVRVAAMEHVDMDSMAEIAEEIEEAQERIRLWTQPIVDELVDHLDEM